MHNGPQYYAPQTLAQALTVLGEKPQTSVLAGGTDLLVHYHEALDTLEGILDIQGLEELKVFRTGPEISLGALITHDQICQDPFLQEHVPFLCAGALEVGSPQIRHRGTVGGNIVNASPAADTLPPLMVLGARVNLASQRGSREMDLNSFFLGPGQCALEEGELLVSVSFPKPHPLQAGSYIKVGQRKALAIAVASLALYITADEKKEYIKDVAICLGSVAPVPFRARETEALLQGAPLKDIPLEKAGKHLSEEISPIDDIRGSSLYRRQVAGNILGWAMEDSLKRLEVKGIG